MELLYDKILKHDGQSIISPFSSEKVGSISYDLTVDKICNSPGSESERLSLAPGDSAFIMSLETISLPGDVLATISLRNHCLRQGLALDAPVYHPGHRTRVFFRVTNVSHQEILIKKGDGLAQIMFYKLPESVEHPYSGAFADEFNYTGMGSYTSPFDASQIAEKVDSVKTIEKSIYGNVLSIMAVFVAAFTLININVSAFMGSVDLRKLLLLDFVTVGCIAFLLSSINTMLPMGRHIKAMWGSCLASFAISFLIAFL